MRVYSGELLIQRNTTIPCAWLLLFLAGILILLVCQALPRRPVAASLLTTRQTQFGHHFLQLIAIRFFSCFRLRNFIAEIKFNVYHYENNLFFSERFPLYDTQCPAIFFFPAYHHGPRVGGSPPPL
jgi:hypothetical protein